MKIVIFGLSVSSSWGNGHATLWRGLCKALAGWGHTVTFFERDVPYYAAHRDLSDLPGGILFLYSEWTDAIPAARKELAVADAAIVTSYCPDGIAASDLVLDSTVPLRVFYDLDTPITLSRLRRGLSVDYIGPRGLRDFDLVFSYTGGDALTELRDVLGARRVAPLYGSVDPSLHRPVEPKDVYRCGLSYLGTYAKDRQAGVNMLFVEPARRMPECRFLMGGSLYDQTFPWTSNIFFKQHVTPAEHSAFYCSSKLTLNVTRWAMREKGFCPSGRLFEAAACGVPVITDDWEGLDRFFQPGSEILIARSTADVIDALATPETGLAAIARRARERTLEEHTADRRASEMVSILEAAKQTPVLAAAKS